jgi:predicted nicotinamide N-methyase
MKKKSLWQTTSIGDEAYTLLNLDHPSVERRILDEMEQGIEVYYDRRWQVTDRLCEWLVNHREWLCGKHVLVLGAGVGAETLPLARHGAHIWINDLSPTALSLCAEQLRRNGFTNVSTLPGRYQDLALPEVDLVVASFLIYNRETLSAFRSVLPALPADLLLVNENLVPFQRFLGQQAHESLFLEDGIQGVLIAAQRSTIN